MPEETSPTNTVLHLRFKLRVPPHEFLAHCREAAIRIASLKGLIWKIWVFEEQQSEIGGIYLFANRESAVAYLNHPIIQTICSNPAVMTTDSQLWDVQSSFTGLTRGPVPGVRELYSESEALVAGGR